MKKKQTITLSIPNPCDEDWDKMTITEKGRHCASCNKTVIDFSNYTDKELVDYLKQRKGSSCGNFTSYQLNRPLLLTTPPNRSFLHKLFYGTAFAAWLTGSANGQNNGPAPSSPQYIQPINTNNQNSSFTDDNISAIDDSTHYVEGTVKSNLGSPISSVRVSYSINTHQVETDSSGHFKLFIPTEFVGKKVHLYFNNEPKVKVSCKQFPIVLKSPITVKIYHYRGKF